LNFGLKEERKRKGKKEQDAKVRQIKKRTGDRASENVFIHEAVQRKRVRRK